MGNIEKDTLEWQQHGIIDASTAAAIVSYENRKKIPTGNLAIVIFSVLGALLVALGISLMVAENWDQIPKFWKIIISFLPILLGNVLLLLWVFKFKDSTVWKESASTFLYLTTGATLALLSQVFQLQGSITSFLLLWMVLVSPLLVLTKSRAVFILYILFSTWYVSQTYWGAHESILHYVWFLGLILFYFIHQLVGKKETNAIGMVSGWLISVSLMVALGGFFDGAETWLMVAFPVLFQTMLLLFQMQIDEGAMWKNGPGVLGFFGFIFILFMSSYKEVIKGVSENLKWTELFANSLALYSLAILSVLCIILYYITMGKKREPIAFILPVFLLILNLSFYSYYVALVFVNLVILIIGITLILRGVKFKNLLWLNTGLLLFSLLVILRFFDFELSFFVRGLAFLILGASFFLANRYIILEKKEDAE